MPEPGEVDGRAAGQTRSSGLTLLGLLGGAVVAAVLIGQLTSPDPAPRPPAAVATTTSPAPLTTTVPDIPIGVESLKRCPVQLGGLALGEDRQAAGSMSEIWDCDALTQGPWSIVIRATDGHFGVKSAVVTYPVDQDGPGTSVSKPPGGRWNDGAHTLVFPIVSGKFAEIAGDLSQPTLAVLAMRIPLLNGRPHFEGLQGFAASASTTYRFPLIHEMRYGTVALRQERKLGSGEVWSGVTTGASFEFELLAGRTDTKGSASYKQAGAVRGKPAIYSSDPDSNWILAWESAPGEVTYIGYSGPVSSAHALGALRALADKGRMLSPAQWETRNRGQINAQPGTSP